ncbi:heme/hemin ABC transporter substrate-binding protein [Kribbella sp. CA-293567]|uniref:heme/hemin ABC transporter substrate-binding protein n=1 Tax=Kribbella sp. CA-293567 TaxID=3002436 RepID=UPI0022DDC555|nr:ABC transporter substrate-binding protein [Kribbella sp. CA-293567]WBQ03991.1 ABC transporter substrate-binding protein [Kribbella sp. CA-293567]
MTRPALAALLLLAVTACAGPSETAIPGTTAADACRPPVEGFAVTTDADGKPLPKPTENPSQETKDPHTISGPSTATLTDHGIDPVESTQEPSLPVQVKSCDGKSVQVEDVSRIIAVDLYGTLAEIVFSLGLGDQVVGRDTSTGFPEAARLPKVTPSAHDLNAEAILALDPTVVLTDKSIGPPEVLEQLRASGVAVVFFDDARTMDGLPSQVRAVAAALGVPERGEQLVRRTQGEIVKALSLAPRDAKPLRMTFLYVRGTAGVYLMSGPGSGADAMIKSIGGVDTGTDIGLTKPFVPLTSEALIRSQPDLIIVMTEGLKSIKGVDGLVKLPGIAQTPAGRNRRVIDMNDSELLGFGPRTGRTVEALAKAVYAPARS